MTIGILGKYHDQLSQFGHPLMDLGWRKNRIMNGCRLLLAALMKDANGFGGIMYLAMGEGLKEWDGSPPQPDPSATGLVREIMRRPITAGEIVFLDETGQPGIIPTNRLQIDLLFSRDDFEGSGIQPIREFGLFGGNATALAGSGFFINHVMHPRIDISAGLTLQRTLRLDFSQEFTPHISRSGNFGGRLPVQCIDGVGEVYGAALNAGGILTLSDLAASSPHLRLENIPVVKLMEFRTKAALVMGIDADFSPLAGMADVSVSDILKLDPFSGQSMRGIPIAEPDPFLNLQEKLMVLQVALDEWELKKLTGRELLDRSVPDR
ncbi:MAG: hypothetical protein V1706_11495 [Pseudomonadota bacterium]